MNRLHPRIKPSAGAGLGKTLIESHLDGDATTLAHALNNFTDETILSSLWETQTWVSAHSRIHGSIDRIDQLHAAATTHLNTDGDAGQWATEFVETFDEALQHDAEALPNGTRRLSRRPMVGRPIFTTWLLIQEPRGVFATTGRPYVGFDGPRGAFRTTIIETGVGMIEGAIRAAAAITQALADDEEVPVPLLLSVVNAVTLQRGMRGDYVG